MTETKPATDPAAQAINKLKNQGYLFCDKEYANGVIRQAYAPILAAAEEMAKQLELRKPLDRSGFAALATYRELVPKEQSK